MLFQICDTAFVFLESKAIWQFFMLFVYFFFCFLIIVSSIDITFLSPPFSVRNSVFLNLNYCRYKKKQVPKTGLNRYTRKTADEIDCRTHFSRWIAHCSCSFLDRPPITQCTVVEQGEIEYFDFFPWKTKIVVLV